MEISVEVKETMIGVVPSMGFVDGDDNERCLKKEIVHRCCYDS